MATRLAAISVIVGLLVLVFYLAMNTANIYLLLSDGMKMRTGVLQDKKCQGWLAASKGATVAL